jgi:hypothetical protein
VIRARKGWLLGVLALAGCGLSAAAIGGLVGGVATVVGTIATVYVESAPSATATPSPEPLASPVASVIATGAPSASSTPTASPTPGV